MSSSSVNLTEQLTKQLCNVAIAFAILQTVFYVLFAISRLLQHQVKSPELWLMLLSYLCNISIIVMAFLGVKIGGAGRHIMAILGEDSDQVTELGKIAFTIDILWSFGVTLPKLAVLVLYMRIFTSPGYRSIIRVVGLALIINWLLLLVPMTIKCKPASSSQNKTHDNTCQGAGLDYELTSLSVLFIDLIMAILPLPAIWQLHIDTPQKVSVTIAFLTGSCGIVTAFVRVYYCFTVDFNDDITYNSAILFICSIIQPAAYLIAVSLCSVRLLFRIMLESKGLAVLRTPASSIHQRGIHNHSNTASGNITARNLGDVVGGDENNKPRLPPLNRVSSLRLGHKGVMSIEESWWISVKTSPPNSDMGDC